MKSTLLGWALMGTPLLGCALNPPGKEGSPFDLKAVAPLIHDATLPWMTESDPAWQQREPLFEMADPADPAFRMKGWLAATREELLVRVDVGEASHTNAFTGRKIRDGDFIRLALDGKGDGPGRGPIEADGLFGDDDAAICFALTESGPEGWTFDTGDSAYAGAYPAELLNFVRDEEQKITRYSIRLPWKRIAVRPGVFPQFGLALQAQHADGGGQAAARLTWGGKADEPKAAYFKANRPGLYKKIGWEPPPHELMAVAPSVTQIWQAGEAAEFMVALASSGDVVIRAAMGATHREFPIRGQAGPGIRRFSLGYRPAAGLPAEPVKVSVFRNGIAEPVDAITTQVVIAETVAQDCLKRLDELIAGAGHPLFLRHLRSVKGMVQTAWARATVTQADNAAQARETLEHIGTIAAGFRGRSADWASYVEEGQPLFMAYVSPRDGTLQWYALTLPKGWDPDKPRERQAVYPMFLELHGSMNPHYLFYPAAHLGATQADPALTSFAMRQRHGYHVYPFGRGNSGYRDIGETDVWEAYADVQQTVAVDPDRRYLYGFSMGGGGTWRLGSRTPDRWAAIAIMGAGVQVEPWGQAENVKRLPIYLWGGETDTLGYGSAMPPREQMDAFAKAIEAAGGSVTVRSTPGIGHNYRIKEQEELVNWLQQRTRKRPDTFSFVADTDQHRGIWGITLARKSAPNALPRFTCEVEGPVVRVTAEGASPIDIQLGPNGLAMTGSVTLILNGQERYRGEATSHRFDWQAE